MSFINKSGILEWSEKNINNIPNICGVYVLRDNTTIGGILYVGMARTGRFKERILEHFNSGDIPGVRFFDWYQTKTEEDASALERFWISKYIPPHNKQN